MSEPAIKARISPTNEALFKTVEDFLRWTAHISTVGQFVLYHRKAGGGPTPIEDYKRYRSPAELPALEAVLNDTLCTDGRPLIAVMREQNKKKRPPKH